MGKSASLEFYGHLSFNYFYFLENKPLSELGSEAFLKFQTKFPFALVLSPYILLDFNTDGRSASRLGNELYLDYLAEKFELRIGWQKFDWEVTKSRQAADFLNQKDYEYNLLQPFEMGEAAIRSRIILNKSSQHYFDIIYLPIFRPTLLPEQNNNYHLFEMVDGQDFRENSDEQIYFTDSLKAYRPQGVARYNFPLNDDLSLSFFYFNGYERFPVLIKNINIFSPYYRPIHKGGTTLAARTGQFGFKGEVVYNRYEDDTFYQFYRLIDHTNKIKTEPYMEFTGGVDYYFNPPTRPVQWVSSLELILDSDFDRPWSELQSFRPFRNHVFISLQRFNKGEHDRKIKIEAFLNFIDPGIVYRLEWGEMVYQNLMLMLGFSGLNVDESSWLKGIEDTMNARFGCYLFF